MLTVVKEEKNLDNPSEGQIALSVARMEQLRDYAYKSSHTRVLCEIMSRYHNRHMKPWGNFTILSPLMDNDVEKNILRDLSKGLLSSSLLEHAHEALGNITTQDKSFLNTIIALQHTIFAHTTYYVDEPGINPPPSIQNDDFTRIKHLIKAAELLLGSLDDKSLPKIHRDFVDNLFAEIAISIFELKKNNNRQVYDFIDFSTRENTLLLKITDPDKRAKPFTELLADFPIFTKITPLFETNGKLQQYIKTKTVEAILQADLKTLDQVKSASAELMAETEKLLKDEYVQKLNKEQLKLIKIFIAEVHNRFAAKEFNIPLITSPDLLNILYIKLMHAAEAGKLLLDERLNSLYACSVFNKSNQQVSKCFGALRTDPIFHSYKALGPVLEIISAADPELHNLLRKNTISSLVDKINSILQEDQNILDNLNDLTKLVFPDSTWRKTAHGSYEINYSLRYPKASELNKLQIKSLNDAYWEDLNNSMMEYYKINPDSYYSSHEIRKRQEYENNKKQAFDLIENTDIEELRDSPHVKTLIRNNVRSINDLIKTQLIQIGAILDDVSDAHIIDSGKNYNINFGADYSINISGLITEKLALLIPKNITALMNDLRNTLQRGGLHTKQVNINGYEYDIYFGDDVKEFMANFARHFNIKISDRFNELEEIYKKMPPIHTPARNLVMRNNYEDGSAEFGSESDFGGEEKEPDKIIPGQLFQGYYRPDYAELAENNPHRYAIRLELTNTIIIEKLKYLNPNYLAKIIGEYCSTLNLPKPTISDQDIVFVTIPIAKENITKALLDLKSLNIVGIKFIENPEEGIIATPTFAREIGVIQDLRIGEEKEDKEGKKITTTTSQETYKVKNAVAVSTDIMNLIQKTIKNIPPLKLKLVSLINQRVVANTKDYTLDATNLCKNLEAQLANKDYREKIEKGLCHTIKEKQDDALSILLADSLKGVAGIQFLGNQQSSSIAR